MYYFPHLQFSIDILSLRRNIIILGYGEISVESGPEQLSDDVISFTFLSVYYFILFCAFKICELLLRKHLL